MQTGITELSADHPGFNDAEYRARRNTIAQLATGHRSGDVPPTVDYTPTENATWAAVYAQLVSLHPTHACREFREAFPLMGFAPDRIPQQSDMHAILQRLTGFSVEPVAGLVSNRDFLGALAKRIFPCTQYIRHHSVPHYTPEPDICHEMLGHVPMLANREFSDLTQKFGEASLGATDAQLDELARLYWYTVEFGVLREAGQLRAYGAGLLSSYGELRNAVEGGAEIRAFDAEVIRSIVYPITTYQTFLFEVPSIRGAFEMMDAFVRRMKAS